MYDEKTAIQAMADYYADMAELAGKYYPTEEEMAEMARESGED